MHKIHITLGCLFLLSTQFVFAQFVVPKIEKNEFKTDEIIEYRYVATLKVDSFGSIKVPDFEVIGGPEQSHWSSTVNGITTDGFTLHLKIKAKEAGEYKISSPAFYNNGNSYYADPVYVKVKKQSLTQAEKKEIAYKKFIEEYGKPEGTLTYVIKDNFGYIEEYKNNGWVFVRRLSEEELKNFPTK